MADLVPEGKVAVGRDMRHDSKALSSAVIKGLIQQGRQVEDLGLITTDMMYFAVGKYEYSGGAMITASHNPGEYNGLKLTNKNVVPIAADTGLDKIKEALKTDQYKESATKGAVTKRDILSDWVKHALSFAPELKPLHVGIDAGNGMGGIVVPELRAKTPLKIKGLFLKPDGDFPNHPANPLIFENLGDLINLVKENKLDCGIAFDGDGDRAFLVDEKGDIISGSVLSALLITKFLRENPGSTILYNAICSRIVPETIERMGGTGIRTKVGHGFIKAEMRKHDALLACEHSGHFYFKKNYNADSGLIAALCGLEILSQSKKHLSGLTEKFRGSYVDSGEINFEVADQAAMMKKIAKTFDDGEQDFLDGVTINYPEWWLNVRPSNNEPLLRLNVEAKSQFKVDEVVAKVTALIKDKA
jgi:phosphomannomutase